jgi:hypothetical protein
MSTAAGIAQWVINNRYPKSESDKLTDAELFQELKFEIEQYGLACLEKASSKVEIIQYDYEEEKTEKVAAFSSWPYFCKIDRESITSKENLA